MNASFIRTPENFSNDIFKIHAAELEAGQDVNGRYLIGDKIAETHHSNVFDAIDGENGQRVVLKAHVIADTDMLGAFVMEGAFGQAFSEHSNNVVRHLESGISKDYRHPFGYTVMEKTDGTMADRIKASPSRKLDLREFTTMAVPGFGAVEEMHRVNVVQADIKPGNLHYMKDRRGIVVDGAISDFGVSRVESIEPKLLREYSISRDAIVDQPTQELSPYYMPPEVFMGESDCTKAGDSFSAAVTSFIALVGRYPRISMPSGTGERSEMQGVAPPTPAEFDNTLVRLPRSLIETIIAGCERNPANRPTMPEIVQELRAARYAHA